MLSYTACQCTSQVYDNDNICSTACYFPLKTGYFALKRLIRVLSVLLMVLDLLTTETSSLPFSEARQERLAILWLKF